MTDHDLAIEIQRMAAGLVEADARLDYSEASLTVVEEMLGETSNFIDAMSASQVESLVPGFGCYILEVARRALGGRYLWHTQRDAPVLVIGEPEFRVAMLTWDKTRGRLSGDEADNIPFFYAGVAEQVRSATHGVDVLYV
jgi:hypothetical protein